MQNNTKVKNIDILRIYKVPHNMQSTINIQMYIKVIDIENHNIQLLK